MNRIRTERRGPYHICSRCGAHLDPGEQCDCMDRVQPRERAARPDGRLLVKGWR
ncbi:MAG: hypothetical protein LUE91_05465 [Oscillospiraceae bacterium]|nr:hypothetical protein [Oscillospiraceae bacterium]